MEKYKNSLMQEAAKRTVDQISESAYGVFEEFMGYSLEEINYQDFSYGKNDDIWNISAVLLNEDYSVYSSAEEYGREIFYNKLDETTLETHFDFEKYGKDLLELDMFTDEEDKKRYLFEKDEQNLSSEDLEDIAHSYISDQGGITALNDADYEQYFDFNGFGEAEIESLGDNVYCADGKIYDLSELENCPGKKLEKNMAEQIKAEYSRHKDEKEK